MISRAKTTACSLIPGAEFGVAPRGAGAPCGRFARRLSTCWILSSKFEPSYPASPDRIVPAFRRELKLCGLELCACLERLLAFWGACMEDFSPTFFLMEVGIIVGLEGGLTSLSV